MGISTKNVVPAPSRLSNRDGTAHHVQVLAHDVEPKSGTLDAHGLPARKKRSNRCTWSFPGS